MKSKQTLVSQERYEILKERYDKFAANLKNVDVTPVRVFDDLCPKANDELLLIREVSETLQATKDEYLKKQREAAEADEKKKEGEKETTEEEKEKTEEDNKEDK